jgi:hypothetical protein
MRKVHPSKPNEITGWIDGDIRKTSEKLTPVEKYLQKINKKKNKLKNKL